MALIFFNQYLTGELDRETRAAAGIDWTSLKMDLYTNSHTPVHGDTEAGYTKAAYSGYVQQAFPAPQASTVAAAVATANVTTVTFNNTSGSAQSVYGYLISDSGGKAVGAELFTSAPISIPNGTAMTITVSLTLQSLN